MRQVFMTTIKVIIDAGSAAEACDGLAECLRNIDETYGDGSIVDWSYQYPASAPEANWHMITISDRPDYEEGSAFE